MGLIRQLNRSYTGIQRATDTRILHLDVVADFGVPRDPKHPPIGCLQPWGGGRTGPPRRVRSVSVRRTRVNHPPDSDSTPLFSVGMLENGVSVRSAQWHPFPRHSLRHDRKHF